MRLAWTALVGAGCLSTPPPYSASTPDPCDRDVRPSRACGLADDFTARAFPGRPFVPRSAVADDVNSDGILDLVVVSNAPPPDAGVYVLLGPIDAAAPRYHAFLATDLENGDIQIRAVVNEGNAFGECADITVFGRTTDGTTGVVQVWPSGGGDELFAATPFTADATFAPDVTNLPVHVAWARLRDDVDDLIVGDLDTVRVLRVGGDVPALDTADVVEAAHVATPPMFGWASINGLEALAIGDCARDQVVIVEADHGHRLVDGDTAAPAAGPSIAIAAVSLNTELVDLDGAPPLDIVVSGGVEIGAYLLDDAAVATAAGPSMYDPYMDSYRLDAFAVGELGGGAEPELVAIDNPDGAATGSPRAVLIGGLHAEATDVFAGDTPRIYEGFPGGFTPADIVVADLDDDGTTDAWVLSTEGALACLHRGTTVPQLQPCD